MCGASHQTRQGEVMMWRRISTVFLVCVICCAVLGYFVGLNDGVPKVVNLRSTGLRPDSSIPRTSETAVPDDSKLHAAITYTEIPYAVMGPTQGFRSVAKTLPSQANYDLFAEITLSPTDKEASSRQRASRRAYNGAPPIIPHAIQNTNDAACYACHANGMRMAGLKASVMSHPFLVNCTQCHASPPPAPFQDIDFAVASSFVGLPAPKAGQRAFPGAPPAIPHSQWMRQNCIACHGGPNGWAGMESTHPWRTNCTQCHAPSAVLDQAIAVDSIPMLPPLDVANR